MRAHGVAAAARDAEVHPRAQQTGHRRRAPPERLRGREDLRARGKDVFLTLSCANGYGYYTHGPSRVFFFYFKKITSVGKSGCVVREVEEAETVSRRLK